MLEILRLTREILADPDNWCKGRFEDRKGAMCLAHAVYEATCRLNPEDVTGTFRKSTLASRALATLTPHQNVILFNDDPKTTHQHVLNLLDKGIECASF